MYRYDNEKSLKRECGGEKSIKVKGAGEREVRRLDIDDLM